MKSWTSLKKELLKDKKTALEYNKLEPRYRLITQLIEARLKSGVTQVEVAKKIGTSQSAVARLESGHANASLEFIERYLRVINPKLNLSIG